MAADTKEILDGAVHREKPLRVRGGLEAAHLTFPLPGRLVRDFGPVVRVPVRAAGRGVAAECVGDQSSRDTALAFQQLAEEAEGRPPIAPGLHEDVDRVAIPVYGTPQILLPPLILTNTSSRCQVSPMRPRRRRNRRA